MYVFALKSSRHKPVPKEIEKWFKHMIEQYPERKFTVQNVYVRNICVLEQRMGRQSNGKLTLRIKREKSIRISV